MAKKSKAPSNEQMFFTKLLALAREYNVTLHSDSLFFYDEKTKETKSVYTWVEVNGAWKIAPEHDALVAVKQITPPTETQIVLKGTP